MVTYVKISELPPATEATGDSELEVNQAGVTRKITVDQIADVIAAILPPPDMTGYATDEELADAIAAVELLPGPPGPAGEDGAAGPPGATGPPGTTSWTGITDKPSTFPPDPEAIDDRVAALIVAGSNMTATYNDVANTLTLASTASGGGGGTVTSTSVVSANGLAGTVATPTTTPAITLSTTVTGMLKGNGTAISAGTAGTDYMTPGNVSAAYQPLDADLTALAGLNATAGLVEQTGAAAFTKRLMGVANATDVLTRAGGDGRYLGIAASAPPSGAATGDLTGTYPAPTIKADVVLSGNPTTTTQTAGNNTTRIATTAFVTAALAGGGASISVGTSPPGSPAANALWWNSDAATGGGQLMIFYNDGSTTQWVPASPGMSTPTTPGGDFYATGAGGAVSTGAAAVVIPNTVLTGNSPAACYSTSTGRYTPPAGRYSIFGIVVALVGAGSAASLFAYIFKNGVQITAGAGGVTGANWTISGNVDIVVDANGTDYFELRANASAATTFNNFAFGAFPISGVKGPPGDPGVGLLQTQSFQTSAAASGTTLIPLDDTIPQITEGTEFMTLAFTPRSATSKLIIDVLWFGMNDFAGQHNLTVALFQDSTANALAAVGSTGPVNAMHSILLRHTMISGTTSARTFRVRAGGVGAGNTWFNGFGGRMYGGVAASSIVIQEVL